METADSRRRHHDEDFNPIDITFTFSAMLECNHCKENVSCCGNGGVDLVVFPGEDGNTDYDYREEFFPKFFSPGMKMLTIPRQCPSAPRAQLQKSFAVFFCDLSAAANHVRQCIEEILNHAGVDRQNAGGGLKSLDSRINEFAARDRENGERALALKWIGNFGSHPEPLTRGDLFDAYDILEVLLEDLYVGHQRSVRRRVEQINAARGPVR